MKRALILAPFLLFGLASCRQASDHSTKTEGESWSVTAWGEFFELFPEVEPLVAGRSALATTHVTVLADFTPLRDGTVAAVLTDDQGQEAAFEQRIPKRDGIYSIEIKPSHEGVFALSFRVRAGTKQEEIPAGRVRVGSVAAPGGLVEQPKPPHGTSTESAARGTSFLKEQQWKTEFGTAWVQEGSLAGSISAPARVVAPSGGEVLLTAPVDAMLLPRPWPHRGLAVAEGSVVFELVPKGEGDRSLADLESEVTSLEGEAHLARTRAERLTDLLKLEATSRTEADRAKVASATLDARVAASRRDLEAARAARAGTRATSSLPIRAPWAGQVAEVVASPGQSVAAGAPLARVVKQRPVWLDAALRPEDAAKLDGEALELFIRRPSQATPLEVRRGDARLISRAPEIDSRTATLGVLIEVALSTSDLPIGSAVEAEILMGGEQRGIVIPASALIDDGGVLVAYEHVSGESFVRHEVRVHARQGTSALVSGLSPGTRLVTRGAAAIRRASLLSSGAPEGHVH